MNDDAISREVAVAALTAQHDSISSPGIDTRVIWGRASVSDAIDIIRALPALPEPAATDRETAWLAETTSTPHEYLEANHVGRPVALTKDPWKARRFTSRAAALQELLNHYVTAFLPPLRAVEHVFIPSSNTKDIPATTGKLFVTREQAKDALSRMPLTGDHDEARLKAVVQAYIDGIISPPSSSGGLHDE